MSKKRSSEHIKLSDVLKEFVATNKLQSGLDKVNVKDVWYELMGKGVANYTTDVTLKKDVLYVKLRSSVLREELSYGREKIINLLNEALGKPLISKLILQ